MNHDTVDLNTNLTSDPADDKMMSRTLVTLSNEKMSELVVGLELRSLNCLDVKHQSRKDLGVFEL